MSGSATFHTCYVVSEDWANFLQRLDYSGIALLTCGSAYPPIYYMFACSPLYSTRLFFMTLITVTSTLTLILSLMPFFAQPIFRPVRGLTFIFLGLSAAAHFLYLPSVQNGEDAKYALPLPHHWPWILGGVAYIAGAVTYMTRVPERFFPVKFDIIGSSH